MSDNKKTSTNQNRNDEAENNKQKTAADFEETVRQAEAETKTAKPGESQGNSKQHNNGRGGGK